MEFRLILTAVAVSGVMEIGTVKQNMAPAAAGIIVGNSLGIHHLLHRTTSSEIVEAAVQRMAEGQAGIPHTMRTRAEAAQAAEVEQGVIPQAPQAAVVILGVVAAAVLLPKVEAAALAVVEEREDGRFCFTA